MRLEKEPAKIVAESIQKHLEFLKEQTQLIEKQIEFIINRHAKDEMEVLALEKGVGIQTAAILLASLPSRGARITAKSRNWWDSLRWHGKAERYTAADIFVVDELESDGHFSWLP